MRKYFLLIGSNFTGVAQQAMRDIKAFGSSPKMAKLRNLVKVNKIYRLIIFSFIQKWLEAIDERNVTFQEFTTKTGFETLKKSFQKLYLQNQFLKVLAPL